MFDSGATETCCQQTNEKCESDQQYFAAKSSRALESENYFQQERNDKLEDQNLDLSTNCSKSLNFCSGCVHALVPGYTQYKRFEVKAWHTLDRAVVSCAPCPRPRKNSTAFKRTTHPMRSRLTDSQIIQRRPGDSCEFQCVSWRYPDGSSPTDGSACRVYDERLRVCVPRADTYRIRCHPTCARGTVTARKHTLRRGDSVRQGRVCGRSGNCARATCAGSIRERERQ